MAIEEAKNLNSISIDSFVNSLISYELKLKSKVQDKEKARIKKSNELKISQEKDDLFLLDGKDVKVDELKPSKNSLTMREDLEEMGQATINF